MFRSCCWLTRVQSFAQHRAQSRWICFSFQPWSFRRLVAPTVSESSRQVFTESAFTSAKVPSTISLACTGGLRKQGPICKTGLRQTLIHSLGEGTWVFETPSNLERLAWLTLMEHTGRIGAEVQLNNLTFRIPTPWTRILNAVLRILVFLFTVQKRGAFECRATSYPTVKSFWIGPV